MRMSFALIGEIADALALHRNLRCTPRVEMDDGVVEVTIRVAPNDQEGSRHLATINLYNDLAIACDVATMRAITRRYDISPASLEDLIRKREEIP